MNEVKDINMWRNEQRVNMRERDMKEKEREINWAKDWKNLKVHLAC